MNKSLKYLIISTITFTFGYFFLRTAYYSSQENPFANEIILIILGTIATIAITAALLNKQSEVELEKEQNVKLFDIKSSLYFELIDFIEEIIVHRKISKKDLIRLDFLTHKISVIANKEVLKEYANFIMLLKKVSSDIDVTRSESIELSIQLNQLCSKIRYDLINKEKHVSDLKNLIFINSLPIKKND